MFPSCSPLSTLSPDGPPVRNAVQAGSSIDLDYRVVRPDGRIRRLHGRAEVVADDDGRPIRLAGTVQDVTEMRAAEDALERTAAELTRRALELHRVARHGAHADDKLKQLSAPVDSRSSPLPRTATATLRSPRACFWREHRQVHARGRSSGHSAC